MIDNYPIIHLEAVLDIIGHTYNPAIQLATDGHRIGIAPPTAATQDLIDTVNAHKPELLHHIAALARAQRKYNTRLHIEQQLEATLNIIGSPGWKDDPAFTEWQALTRELSQLINRLETLLGREITSAEAIHGFDHLMEDTEK